MNTHKYKGKHTKYKGKKHERRYDNEKRHQTIQYVKCIYIQYLYCINTARSLTYRVDTDSFRSLLLFIHVHGIGHC